MKLTAFKQLKKWLESAKGYTTIKISELATTIVEAIEEVENNKANKDHKHSVDDITSGMLSVVRGGTGNTTGNAVTATKLQTARTIRTNLASTSSSSFDGSANITPGVTGTLPIANGGTGAITASVALEKLGGFPKSGGTITGATTISNTLTVSNDVTMNANAKIIGNLTLKGSGNYGNKINFGDGDYVHLYEISDDKLEIKASNVNFVVSGSITKNGTAFGEITKNTIDDVMIATGTGTLNVCLGDYTLEHNTTGYRNTALGYCSMGYNETGSQNTAVGGYSLYNSKETYDNVAIGYYSLFTNTAGNYNTAIGSDSLRENTTGTQNTAVGKSSLYKNTTGINNTALGHNSLPQNTTGSQNTALGSDTLNGLTSYSNCTGVGYGANVTGSNQVQLGNTSVTVYAQKALVTRSDARDKLDIENSPLGLNFIMKLRPVKYRLNSREAYFEKGKERDFNATNDGSKAGKRPHYGLVAQEVKEVMNDLGVDFAGYLDSNIDGGEDVLSLGYTEFIAPIIKAMQQQQEMIEQLQQEVEFLKRNNSNVY